MSPIRKLSPDFADALSFTAFLHVDQMRKLSPEEKEARAVPYIAHLMAVASIVLEHGGTEDEAIGALLHDALEDQAEDHDKDPDGLAARIERRFGSHVLGIVRECSDWDGKVRLPWRERKEAYIASVATKSRSAILVTAADKLHNARSIVGDVDAKGDATWNRFSSSPGEIVWYYDGLLDALGAAFAKHSLDMSLIAKLEREVILLRDAATKRKAGA